MIDYITGPDPEERFNYLRLYMFFSLPVVVIIASYIFWVIYGCLFKMTSQQRNDCIVATISIIWALFYPKIVSNIA